MQYVAGVGKVKPVEKVISERKDSSETVTHWMEREDGNLPPGWKGKTEFLPGGWMGKSEWWEIDSQ